MRARSVLTVVLAASAASVVVGCAGAPDASVADSTAAPNQVGLTTTRGWNTTASLNLASLANAREAVATADLNRASLNGSGLPASGAATSYASAGYESNGYASYGYTDASYTSSMPPQPAAWQNSPYPPLTYEDRDAIGRIAYAEAGNQGDEGRAAVVFTVLNRVVSGRFQGSVQAVIDAPGEFEPINRVGTWRYLPPLSADRSARIETMLDMIYSGQFPDITNGALFFQNARIVANRAARGAGSSYLVDFGGTPPVAEIGDHRFYDWRAAVNLAAARSRPVYADASYAYYDQPDATYVTYYQEGYGPGGQTADATAAYATATDQAEEVAPSIYDYGDRP